MATYKGYFKPKNPQKYIGDPTNIIYRSRWELLVMSKLDAHPDVMKWGSEELTIPYISPIDKKIHRYYPDFYVMKKNYSDGKITECVIEVKPYAQTKQPKPVDGKPNRRYLNEVYTWGINDAKWKAAKRYCEDRGWEFLIMTEKELGIKF